MLERIFAKIVLTILLSGSLYVFSYGPVRAAKRFGYLPAGTTVIYNPLRSIATVCGLESQLTWYGSLWPHPQRRFAIGCFADDDRPVDWYW